MQLGRTLWAARLPNRNRTQSDTALRRRPSTTTTTPGGLRRKVFYLDEEEALELRRRAFEAEVTESELVRKALRQYFDLPPGRDA